MVRYPVFLVLMLCLAASVASAGEIAIDPKAPAYHNARFGFSLSWTPGQYTVRAVPPETLRAGIETVVKG